MAKYDTDKSEVDLKFEYPILDSPMLDEIRNIVNLKLNLNINEIDKAKDIIGYAHSLFGHDGNNVPSANDPLTILTEASKGNSFRCVEYSILACGLLWAYNIPSRVIGLKTRDVETREYGAGHVVIEFWSTILGKWILCDVQAGLIPYNRDAPLAAYEISELLDGTALVRYETVTGSKTSPNSFYDDKPNYTEWIREYLYFIDAQLKLTLVDEDKRLQKIAMLVPIGAKTPRTFQGMFEMNAVYTHSVLDFYKAPVQ